MLHVLAPEDTEKRLSKLCQKRLRFTTQPEALERRSAELGSEGARESAQEARTHEEKRGKRVLTEEAAQLQSY
eukprot:5853704-Pleurochrysis_carterae.AAC.4